MKITPQAAWIWGKWDRALAFGFGSGLSLKAPGTVGTLYAWAIYLLFYAFLDPFTIATIIGLGAIAGIWICGKVGEELGVPDYGGIVWDYRFLDNSFRGHAEQLLGSSHCIFIISVF
jgi:phosphatidylglycerophosphatase A